VSVRKTANQIIAASWCVVGGPATDGREVVLGLAMEALLEVELMSRQRQTAGFRQRGGDVAGNGATVRGEQSRTGPARGARG